MDQNKQPTEPIPVNHIPEQPPQQSASPLPKKQHEGWRATLSTIFVLIMAPLFALVLIFFVFQSYQVDGPSMETTLEPNDRLIVWKLPRTLARVTGNDYIPKRGDVVVFSEQNQGSLGQRSNKQLIKRVIGLPGDRVVIHDGTVTIYNQQYPNGYQPDVMLPYGETVDETTSGDIDIMLENNELYVLGDNRSNSLDSRAFGPIEANDIVGKLVARFWPIDNMKAF